MKASANMLTSDLLQNHGPLTAKDVYPKAWEARKLNSNTSSMIQSLKAEGRKLELQWKASTKGTSQLENQRSFWPTVIRIQNSWKGCISYATCSYSGMGLWTGTFNT